MAGVRKKRQSSGKYQAWFIQAEGSRKFFTGTHERKETLRIAQRLEDEHRQIRLNYRPAPKLSDKAGKRAFWSVAKEYLEWGRAQGGKGGEPWCEEHASKREVGLRWWQQNLGLDTLGDLAGILARVEAAQRELLETGLANLTIEHRASCLKAFCGWALRLGYVATHPLKGLVPFEKTARNPRRALTHEEIAELLNTSPPHRQLTYEVALVSGLRAKELRSLRVANLDTEANGLRLDKRWTKNGQGGFQPLPKWLVEKLAASSKGKPQDAALLRVGRHTARDLDKDLEAAGIPKWAPGGKVDFHALRVAYTTLVDGAGATVKEAQTLARHSTPSQTFNTYVRARDYRLAALAEAVGETVRPGPKRALCVHKKAVGVEGLDVNPMAPKELPKMAPNGGGFPCAPAIFC